MSFVLPAYDLVPCGLFDPETAALTRTPPAPGDLPAMSAPLWEDARWESQSLQLLGRQR